jgi:hypothetical protein
MKPPIKTYEPASECGISIVIPQKAPQPSKKKKEKKNEYINGHALECWELLPALQLRTVHVYEFDLTLTRFHQKSIQTMIQ